MNDTMQPPPNCGFWCHPPEFSGIVYSIDLLDPPCDPTDALCPVRATIPSHFPGNSRNSLPGASFVRIEWFRDGQNVGVCGLPGGAITRDRGEAWIRIGFNCPGPDSLPNTTSVAYTMKTTICPGATGCPMPVVDLPVTLQEPTLVALFCPPGPPVDGCPDDQSCSCCHNGGGGTSVNVCSSDTGADAGGPGARLRYRAGGTGHPAHPKPAHWNTQLGRY